MLILSRQIKIRKIWLISLFVLISINCFCQGKILRDSIYDILKQKSDGFEVMKLNDDKIKLIYIDTFLVQNKIGAIRGCEKLDTISIVLSFEDSWDSLKFDQVQNENKRVIDILSAKFVYVMDSINWKGVKTNRASFNSDKVRQLRMFSYEIKWTKEERFSLDKLIRLPDFIFSNCGVFLDCTPSLAYQIINKKEIEKKYLERLDFISNDVFKTKNLVSKLEKITYGKEIYE